MKVKINSYDELSTSISDVIARTPHALSIHPTVKLMHGFIAPKLDFSRDLVEWFFRKGAPSRSVWITYQDATFYFRYEVNSAGILMKKDSMQGDWLETFSADDSEQNIAQKLAKHFP
ncbi:hypothetical protein [Roseicitreum antarcticum]|uniref:Integron cassette protein VCH-CASS1 chain domain-containing protein n=1 Tax=Roseicitreum antarcticum TaxID=564137 RepID=A0A1H2ZUT3_9RHOB|nr:hypothetical protein [Roseicitreum antarcticum]SDX20648.1 hypothetical protein SAMN04488238_10662 [Roseicitreum antarcticum]